MVASAETDLLTAPVLLSRAFSDDFLCVPEHAGAFPLHVSGFDGCQAGRAEFVTGADQLGLGTDRKPLRPQQFIVADALNAVRSPWVPLFGTFALCIPRRASKSSTVLAVALGRMMLRDDYQVAYTHVTQQAAQKRFVKDVVEPIQRRYPDPKTSPWIIVRSPGAMFIKYKATGSAMVVVGPTAEAFIGNAFDLIICDEAQELPGGEAAEDLLRGMLPTMDSRTFEGVATGQLILLGTAGAHKSGLFWETLERGRIGQAGIVEFAADPATPLHDHDRIYVEGTTSDPEVWKRAHPGIGNITALSTVEERFLQIAPVEFARDYLGIWPDVTQSGFLDLARWQAMGTDEDQPQAPKQFGLAEVVHRDQTFGAIAVAWYEGEKCHVGLRAHKSGSRWVADETARTALKYNVPITLNMQEGASRIVADEFALMQPKPKLNPLAYAKVAAAAELFVSEFNAGNIVHYNDADLAEAIPRVRKYSREQQRFWSFTSDNREDITAVEAVALAMYAAKNQPTRKPLPNVTLAA